MKNIKYILMGIFAMCSALIAKAVVVETPQTWDNIPYQIKSAVWVWPEHASFYGIPNSYAQFRKSFDLNEVPKSAKIFITADQCYRLYINGKFVCSGPARGYQKSWPYDEIDVANLLQKGKNVIAVRAYNVGRSTFGYLTQGNAGVLFALDLGGGKLIKSDNNIICRLQRGCDLHTAPYSLQLNNQEHIDLRVEDPNWINIDFDDSKWGRVEGTKAYNMMPYYTFEPRMIPMLDEHEMPPAKLVAKATGKSSNSSEKFYNINELVEVEKVSHTPASSTNSAVEIPASENGEFQSYIFDFGRMNVGMPILKVEGAKGGEIVDMTLTETLTNDLQPNEESFRAHCRVALSNRMICRAGDQKHEFFQILGFRYMTIRVRNNSNAIKITPSMRWSAYPMEEKGKFSTSDNLINKIWEASKHTQKICSLDAYVDTPWREQAQWWGDARVQCWNTFFICGDARLLRRGIRSISMQEVPNGLLYGHAPTIAHNCILPDYCLTWITSLWDYYWQTGSAEAYLSHRKTVENLLSYFDSATDPKTGLVKYDARYWLFLDWTDIQRTGQPTVLNMWLLYALDRLTELCKQNGFYSDAQIFAERALKVRTAITENLLDDDGLLCDGIMGNGLRNPSKSIHSQTLAKLNNIKGFNFDKAVKEIFLPYLKEDKLTSKASPSSYWVVYTLMVMKDAGYNAEVFNFIKRKWSEMAEYGTTYENFDANGHSHSHAWSAHPTFLLPQILGGIKQESAGWENVSIKPNYLTDEATIVYPTPKGDIKVSWKKKSDGSFDTKIENPTK